MALGTPLQLNGSTTRGSREEQATPPIEAGVSGIVQPVEPPGRPARKKGARPSRSRKRPAAAKGSGTPRAGTGDRGHPEEGGQGGREASSARRAGPAAAGDSRARGSGAPADSGSAAESKAPPETAAEEGRGTPQEERGAALDAQSVRMVVQHYLPQVRGCYDRALKQADTLTGMVEIKFVISAQGQVRTASVSRNTTGHAGLGNCIAVTLKRWRFPRPVGGEVTFIYPFIFSSGE